jgi:hypothetical protein
MEPRFGRRPAISPGFIIVKPRGVLAISLGVMSGERLLAWSARGSCPHCLSPDYELLRPVLFEVKRRYPEGLAHRKDQDGRT